MKRKLALVYGIAVVALLLAACGTTADSAAPKKPAATEVSCEEFTSSAPPVAISRQLQVATNDTFTLTLCSNASTGFSWETARISDPAILQLVDHKSEPPSTNELGAAGKETWTFKALKPGASTVALDYSRPWEGGEKGVWKFSVQVTVR